MEGTAANYAIVLIDDTLPTATSEWCQLDKQAVGVIAAIVSKEL